PTGDPVAGWSTTGKGRIYSVATPDHANDKAAAGVAALFKDGFQDRPSNELQILLAHADQRVRLEAQFVLAERGNASIPIFTTVALDDSAPLLPRLHALWGLGQLADSKKAQKTIRALLASDQTELRAHAAKLCGDHGIKAEANKLIALLEDTSARVQFFAAQSLGKLAIKKAAKPLVELLRRNDDHDAYLRHAASVALVKINNKRVLQAAAKDPSKAVRLGALLAYRRLGSAEVAALLSDEDPFIVLEAARAINGEDIEDAYGALAALIDSPAAKSDELLAYRVLNANFRLGEESNAQALIDYASNANIDDALRSEAIQHIAAWPSPPQRDRVVGLYRPVDSRPSTYATKALKPLVISLMQDPSGLVQEGVIKAISSLKMMEASDDLYAIVSDPDAQIPARVAALATLDTFKDPRLGELTELASQSEHEALRQAALPVVARLSPEKAAPVLRNIIASGSAEEKQSAFQALEKMEDPVAATILVESIDKLEAGGIPIAAHLELITAAEASQADAVKKKLLERNARLAATGDPLAPYEYSLQGGDRRAGRTVFNENPAMACVRCHQVNGIGGEAGPDLTGLARTNNPTQILEAIIKPNATIAPGFETAIVTKTDGSSVTGTVLDRNESALKLRLPDSTETEIAKSDIANSVSLPSSMPEVFQTLLKPHELRDLMAYLKSLRGGPVNESH
ncbi:MAG: HEAT repeat domain-containing protein, partial [Verrucomicrobiota bacterium]